MTTDPTALPKAEALADVIAEMRNVDPPDYDDSYPDPADYAARLEAAHAREIAARDERIRELEVRVKALEAQRNLLVTPKDENRGPQHTNRTLVEPAEGK